MTELKSLETPTLIDMLVAYMDEYYKLSVEGSSEEKFDQCYFRVIALQEEIASRKKTSQSPAKIPD